MKNDLFISFFFSLAITLLIFWQFFIKGLLPFPGNYLLAWYEPWKTDYTVGKTITIPHKPVADDTFRYLYPFKVLSMDVIKQFELPLWNPYNGAGMPLFATIQSGFLSPFNIFFLFFESRVAWTIYIILQAFLLSFFTYTYCRKIKLSIRASIFASTTILFSGFVIARFIFGNIIYPLIFLPILLYIIEDSFENPKSKKIFFLPITLAILFFSGHPHILFYVLAFQISYFLYKFFTTQKEKRDKTLFVRFFIFILAGIGLSAVQIVPTLELLQNANITLASSKFIFDRFLLPPSHLISILIPNYFGNQATYNYWGAGDYIETVAAVGIIPCFFAFIALLRKSNFKKDIRLFFFISVLVTVLLTLDWFLPKLIFSLPIPIISTSPPSRIFGLTIFSLAILGGYGFDRWVLYKKISKKIFLSTLPFITVVLILLIGTFLFLKLGISCNNQFIITCRTIAVRNTLLEVLFFAATASFFFSYLFFKNKIVRFSPFIIIFLVLMLGIYNSNKFLPFSKENTILPQHPLFTILRAKTGFDRTFGFGQANIKTNFATHFRFFDPNHFDPIYNKRYAELIGFANTGKFPPPLKRSDIEITKDLFIDTSSHLRREGLFNLLGVKYFIFSKDEKKPDNSEKIIWQDSNWYIQENKKSLPRAYIAHSFQKASNGEILKKLFEQDFDPSKNVLLEEDVQSLDRPSNSSNKDSIRITNYKENKVQLSVNTESNGLLVLSDNYYPGWKAFVDGKETKIFRANYTFRAIEISKGKHMVEFTYKPFSFYLGAAISIASLFILFFTLYLFLAKYKR